MTTVDLHCHLLPGVDDGPATMAEALEQARDHVREGRRTVVCTPHVRRDWFQATDEIPHHVDVLRRTLADHGIPLEVRPGAELSIDTLHKLTREQLELVAHGPAGRRWVLVESPWEGIGPDLAAALEHLRRLGFGALLAHPERVDGMLSEASMRVLAAEAARGTRFQLTSRAFVRPYDLPAALELLRRGWVSILATDSHHPGPETRLAPDADAIRKLGLPGDEIERLASHEPARLLAEGIAPGSAPSPAPTPGSTPARERTPALAGR